MKDKDIDFSESPEIPPELFAKALHRQGLKVIPNKKQLTLRLDSEVLSWFRSFGKGYQSKINAILKAYKEAHQKS